MDTDTHGSESELTEAVIGSAFEVANVLGAGFLEKVYKKALIRELALRGVNAKAQVSFPVCYKGQYVGEYLADLLVGERLIVELKCVDRFANEQLIAGLATKTRREFVWRSSLPRPTGACATRASTSSSWRSENSSASKTVRANKLEVTGDRSPVLLVP